MTKRADGKFARKASDFYPTPAAAVAPLIPHLHRTGVKTFVEPCSGTRELVGHLQQAGFVCLMQGDICEGQPHDAQPLDARAWTKRDFRQADASITNPPWEHFTMAGIMEHQSSFLPSWFLIYSDWLFTKQSAALVRERCTDIVPIGRVKWFPDSANTGFDNCCWVRMANQNYPAPTVFWSFPV